MTKLGVLLPSKVPPQNSLFMVKYYCSVLKSDQFLLVLILNSIFFSTTYSQTFKSQKLPKPQFHVLGIVENQFPKYNGEWQDTISLVQYGKNIDMWIHSHQNIIQEIDMNHLENYSHMIDTKLFESLNESQKIKFKEAATMLSFLIKGQKDKLMNDYFNSNSGKMSKRDFYEEVTQVYFVHSDNLKYLYEYITK